MGCTYAGRCFLREECGMPSRLLLLLLLLSVLLCTMRIFGTLATESESVAQNVSTGGADFPLTYYYFRIYLKDHRKQETRPVPHTSHVTTSSLFCSTTTLLLSSREGMGSKAIYIDRSTRRGVRFAQASNTAAVARVQVMHMYLSQNAHVMVFAPWLRRAAPGP